MRMSYINYNLFYFIYIMGILLLKKKLLLPDNGK